MSKTLGSTTFDDSFLMHSTDQERLELYILQHQTACILYGIVQRVEPKYFIELTTTRAEDGDRHLTTSYNMVKKELAIAES